jgi:putative methionine-R-sulfoxide reductase with GAF domain
VRTNLYSSVKFSVNLKLMGVILLITAVLVGFYTWFYLSKFQDVIMADQKNLQDFLITSTSLTIMSIIVGFLLLNRIVMRPLGQLINVTERQLEGDISARAEGLPLDEFGKLSSVLNLLSERVENLISLQERVINDRTRALEATMGISQQISTILDPQQLVKEVVELLKTAFQFYYVQIYLFNESRTDLALAGGTGDVGQTLLSQGHKINRGKGIVGMVAEMNAPILVSNVTKDPNWLPDQLLPDTRSELAVPVAIGNNILGVLDVQQNMIGGLGEEDIKLIQSVANQVAIAVQNSQSYNETKQRAEREALISSIGHKIQGATTIDEALQITLSNLGKAFSVQRASIELGTGQKSSNRIGIRDTIESTSL